MLKLTTDNETNTKHRAASLRQLSFLFGFLGNVETDRVHCVLYLLEVEPHNNVQVLQTVHAVAQQVASKRWNVCIQMRRLIIHRRWFSVQLV